MDLNICNANSFLRNPSQPPFVKGRSNNKFKKGFFIWRLPKNRLFDILYLSCILNLFQHHRLEILKQVQDDNSVVIFNFAFKF